MMEIGKAFQFSSGHVLWRDDWDEDMNIKVFDKCSRAHGHNYSLTVAISGDVDGETGMIMNYYQLTDIINDRIIDLWDHRVLNDLQPFSGGVLPTAENMVLVVLDRMKEEFNQTMWHPTRIHVKETDKTYAEWRFSG
jgi:6-pyruvoyltetrahydropterin/6-carboxytetrahydropterin synthase